MDLLSLDLTSVSDSDTTVKGQVRREKGKKEGEGGDFQNILALFWRSAIMKKMTEGERRNVSHSRNAREPLALWIQQETE